MKVHLDPVGLYSPAMVRVAKALAERAPYTVQITPRANAAEIRVLHVIDAVTDPTPYRFAAIQYCLHTTRWGLEQWKPFWEKAELVWSYYNLAPADTFHFYHAPLGIDRPFIAPYPPFNRNLIVTVGHVTGPCAEAIEEVWDAAESLGIAGVHIGPPNVAGATRKLPSNWTARRDISDDELKSIYHRALYVAGMRHTEGFELPAAEGLACGARALLFDQPSLRHWYGDSAIYIPECAGSDLVRRLTDVFKEEWSPVPQGEVTAIIKKFDWDVIADGFWTALLNREEQ